MAILGIIAALFGVVAVALWRVNQAADAVRNVSDAAVEAHGLWRRFSWRRKLAGDRLELVTDPREAGAAMLVAVAQADAALSQREEAALIEEFKTTFETNDAQARELLAQARWTVAESRDLDRVIGKLSRNMDGEQKSDMLGLMSRIATLEGPASEALKRSLDTFARSLKP